MNKSELIEHAQSLGVEVDPEWTKAEIESAIDHHEFAPEVGKQEESKGKSHTYTNVSKTAQSAFGNIVGVGEKVSIPEKADNRQVAKFNRAIEFGFFE